MEKLNLLIKELSDLGFIIWDHYLSEHILIVKTYEISAYQLHLEFDEQYNRYTASIWTKTESSMFDGDRSDINSLLSFLAAIFFKFSFRMKISLIIQEHPAVENEINALLLFLRESKYIERELDVEAIQEIVDIVLLINMMEMVISQHFNFGPESNLMASTDEEWVEKISDILELDEECTNYSARTNNSFKWVYAPNNGVIHFCFDDKLSFYEKIKEKYSCKSIPGVECLVLKIEGLNDELVAVEYNAISLSEIAAKCSTDDSEKLYIPIDNYLIILGERTITGICCDCSTRALADEIRLIKQRQAIENEFLFEERGFKWNEKINDDEFEKMVMELLYYEPYFSGVRKVGATREGDGNRDLQAMVSWINKEKVRTEKVIIQCKAYQKSVGKSDVKDIRDTIENCNAKGFMVITSSRITVQLQDHLEKLKEQKGYFIDWWNREDIEIRLRRHPEVLERYPNIVNIFGLFQMTLFDY